MTGMIATFRVTMKEKKSILRKFQIPAAFKSPRDKMLFLFDYGDEHIFHVEFLSKSEKAEGTVYPHMVTRKGVAPRQYQ